jgi:tetratricopeptide (TPR) repeat protein
LTESPQRANKESAVKFDPATQRALDRLGDEFVVCALGREALRRENVSALIELGATLTRLRRYEEGLEVDRRLCRLQPDEPIAHYNLACSLALLGRADDAIEEIERSIDLGYDDLEHLVKDRDLRSIRQHPRFDELVRRLRELHGETARDSENKLPD